MTSSHLDLSSYVGATTQAVRKPIGAKINLRHL
jgi:hypothetical protein